MEQSAVAVDATEDQMRPVLTKLLEPGPSESGPQLASRERHPPTGQSRMAASIEIETGRRTSPGCMSR